MWKNTLFLLVYWEIVFSLFPILFNFPRNCLEGYFQDSVICFFTPPYICQYVPLAPALSRGFLLIVYICLYIVHIKYIMEAELILPTVLNEEGSEILPAFISC